MDEDKFENRIHDLEGSISRLERKVENLTLFAAALLGRLAYEIGDAPDLGLPNDEPHTGEYEAQMAMLLAYNSAAGHS